MSKILVIEDEALVQKFLKEVANEQISVIGSEEKNQLQYGDVILNTESHEVTQGGQKIDLTSREYEILKLLMEHPQKVFSRDNLINHIWKYNDWYDERVIDTHIKNIRRKLPSDMIETVRNVGYKLKSQAA